MHKIFFFVKVLRGKEHNILAENYILTSFFFAVTDYMFIYIFSKSKSIPPKYYLYLKISA